MSNSRGSSPHGWNRPARPSGDSGFVCGPFGYQGGGRPKRLPADSVESSGAGISLHTYSLWFLSETKVHSAPFERLGSLSTVHERAPLMAASLTPMPPRDRLDRPRRRAFGFSPRLLKPGVGGAPRTVPCPRMGPKMPRRPHIRAHWGQGASGAALVSDSCCELTVRLWLLAFDERPNVGHPRCGG